MKFYQLREDTLKMEVFLINYFQINFSLNILSHSLFSTILYRLHPGAHSQVYSLRQREDRKWTLWEIRHRQTCVGERFSQKVRRRDFRRRWRLGRKTDIFVYTSELPPPLSLAKEYYLVWWARSHWLPFLWFQYPIPWLSIYKNINITNTRTAKFC